MGILFKDKSKVILSIIGITFFYIDPRDCCTRYTIYEFPPELQKKKQCLDYFIKSIKETHIWKRNQFIKNCELKEPLTFLKHLKVKGVAKMFLLNNHLIQFIFDDKSEVHILKNTRQIIFISEKRERTVYDSLARVMDLQDGQDIKKRILYIQKKFKI